MPKYHIEAKQHWEPFNYQDETYSLSHLNVHKVVFKGKNEVFEFIVTYGLHCFAKDDQKHSIDITYSDSHEIRKINLERYNASKLIRKHIDTLDQQTFLYETTSEKYFIIKHENTETGVIEPLKICICAFKENRLLRLHITSVFFERENNKLPKNKVSIFKIAKDIKRRRKNKFIPKEATRK